MRLSLVDAAIGKIRQFGNGGSVLGTYLADGNFMRDRRRFIFVQCNIAQCWNKSARQLLDHNAWTLRRPDLL